MWPFDNLASSIGRPSLGGLTLKQGALSSQLQEREGLLSRDSLETWGAKKWAGGRGSLAMKQFTWRLCQSSGEVRVTGWVAAAGGASQRGPGSGPLETGGPGLHFGSGASPPRAVAGWLPVTSLGFLTWKWRGKPHLPTPPP